MLSKLLGVSNQSDPVGLEETRMRAATLLSKVGFEAGNGPFAL